MKSPNRRYGNPAEFAYYVQGIPIARIAKDLMRDEKTIRNWLSGRRKIPYWVPELLRLRIEADVARRYEMNTHPRLPGFRGSSRASARATESASRSPTGPAPTDPIGVPPTAARSSGELDGELDDVDYGLQVERLHGPR